MEAAVAASTVMSTLLDLAFRKGHGKMALLVGYLRHGAAAMVAFFTGLLAAQLFRPRREEENNERDRSTSAPARRGEPPAKSSNKPKEEDDGGREEEEPHVFQFKFSFQIPEQRSVGGGGVPAEEDGGSSTVTSVSNCRFFSDGGCRGFVEAPPAMTLRVRESYVDSDGSVRSPPENFDRHQLEGGLGLPAAVGSLDVSNDAVVSNEAVGYSSGALDRRLRRRLSLLKHAKSDGGVPKEFDRELRHSTGVFPSESSPVHGSADAGAAASAAQSTHHRGNSRGAHAPDESEETADVRSPEEAGEPTGSYPGLSSDSESESMSDGYSVKDLSLDFDSDGLFTEEEDVEAGVGRASSSGLDAEEDGRVESEQESEATQLSNSPDSARGSKPSEGEEGAGSQQGAVNVCEEIGREALVSHVLDVQGDLCAAEQGRVHPLGVEEEESESSESRGTTRTELSDACGSDKEPVDLGIGNQNTKGSNLSGRVLDTGDGDDAAEGSDDLGQGSEDEGDSEGWSMEEMEEEMECLWEHDDLLDQLRLDLKKAARAAAAGPLPTILEDSESPKPAEGMEPWKPGTPLFLREDPMEGLHKFYRSYRERMGKLDVLNRQNLYAFGFIRLKDPAKPVRARKPVIPAAASVLSRTFRRRRRRSGGAAGGPSEELVKELRSGIELVYVGQTCLSWEFLRHQYEATRELLGSGDPHGGGRPYNQVAEEFQQFQVLLERFMENEPFQEPRVPNYAKSRCVLRRLLQVPVVREDCFKDKAEAARRRRNSAGATTGEELGYVMEDSIRVFWNFVRSEKGEAPSIVRGLLGAQEKVELQDLADAGFMADIQTNLRQKQKKLKDVLRSGNCIVKKCFKKQQQHGGASQDELFFSQVDMKLVCRVLRMPRITTDQLVWCHKKLSKITFADGKLTREPSFLLFPC